MSEIIEKTEFLNIKWEYYIVKNELFGYLRCNCMFLLFFKHIFVILFRLNVKNPRFGYKWMKIE